ncbi:MAG: helix-turn-helix domain-containing protein [Deinococcales bacterium]
MATSAVCPYFHYAAQLIGKRWTGAILYALFHDHHRFNDIRTSIPELSDRMLSERLKELEAAGLVERHVYDDMPVRIEYTLSPKGKALEPIMDALSTWAANWVIESDLTREH